MELNYVYIKKDILHRNYVGSEIVDSFPYSEIDQSDLLKINDLQTVLLEESTIPNDIDISCAQAQIDFSQHGDVERLFIFDREDKIYPLDVVEGGNNVKMSKNTKDKYDVVIEMVKSLTKPE